jgi:predicted Zn-dependent protease
MFATTRCFRSDRLITLIAAGFVAFAVALVSLGVASPAQADPTHAWSTNTGTVCVESHIGSEWGVRTAIHRWNQVVGGPAFVLEKTCTNYDDTVTVRYQSSGDRYTGWTTWYWDATGHLVHADVTVNPDRIKAFASQDQACQRSHTMTHELGHALGLRHYPHSHAGSVMSYLGWKRHCGGLSAHDRADYAQLYPASPATDEPAGKVYRAMSLVAGEAA